MKALFPLLPTRLIQEVYEQHFPRCSTLNIFLSLLLLLLLAAVYVKLGLRRQTFKAFSRVGKGSEVLFRRRRFINKLLGTVDLNSWPSCLVV